MALKKFSILIPYRKNEERERLLQPVLDAAQDLRMTGFVPEVIVADDNHGSAFLFNHGQAINNAAREATTDLFLIMDADTTYYPSKQMKDALQRADRERCWMLPEIYQQLNKDSTEEVLAGGRFEITVDRCDWEGVSWAGLVVVPREVFIAVRGAEERYEGHGADDVALGLALQTLYAEPVRFPAAAVHLWHRRGAEENAAHNPKLTQRYVKAAGDREKMQALIEEKPVWP